MTLRPSHPRAKPRWIIALGGVGVLLAVAIGSALAVHDDGLFELDTSSDPAICAPITAPCGDANVADPAGGGDDWATIYAGGGAAFGDAFIPDPVSDAETSYYTGGGSKDERDIPAWQYAITNDVVPDKDDIAHAFAAAYTDGGNPAPNTNHTIIYFGIDRYDNNGDAETGFWFFQDRVALGANGAFTGTHRVGDVLVLADWGGSNPVGALTVYQWVGGRNPLQLVSDTAAGGADCAKVTVNDNVCAVVNRQIVSQPWTFLDKGGSNVIRPLELFEAGLDVTALFGADRCFSSFLASTRSSHSTTAQLKDFALGGFEQCGASITISPNDVNEVGQSHTFTVHVSKTVGGAPAPAAGVFPVVTLTGTDGAVASSIVNTCASTGTNASGDCTVSFTSTSTGTITGHATAAVVIGSDTFNVATDGVAPNSGDAVKRFIDANIAIAGNGTNEVGQAHTFTVTVQQDLGAAVVAADNGHVSFTLTPSNGATPVVNTATSTCDDAGDNLSAAGTCTIVFTSATVGQVRGDASVTIPAAVFGTAVDVTRDTNSATATIGAGIGGSEVDPLKTFVDANIAIAGNGTNEVGQAHTFTVTVQKNLGAGAGAVAADNGHVSFTLTPSNGATPVVNTATSTCDDAGDNLSAAGTCTIVFTSATVGQVRGDASVTIPAAVFGTAVDVTRDTNSATATIGAGIGGSEVDPLKTFVDANIAIAGNGTNEVGQAHTFTVTVQKNLGAGAGAVAADNGHVSFTLTPSNGATPVVNTATSTCDDAGDNLSAAGTCTIVFTSATVGQVRGDASVTIPAAVFGTAVDVTRDTNSATATIGAGIGGSEVDPLKTFVDANIAIAGNDTNSIQEPHTFTVTVQQNLGLGGGYVAADNGHVDVTLTNSNGAAYVINGAASTCDDAGDNLSAAGTCTIVFTSNTAGTVRGDATVTIPASVFGTASAVVRDTDPATPAGTGTGGSNTDAVKIFVDGSLTWLKHDGDGELLGGATFEVCMTHRLNSAGAGTMVLELDTNADPLIDSRCFTVIDAANGTATAPDTDVVGGQIKIEDLVLGRYTVRETIPPAGYHIATPPGAGPFTFPDMSIASPDVTLGTIFVNDRAFRIIVIGCDDTTHELVASGVTFDGQAEVQSMTATELGIWNTAHGTSLTEADICGDGTKVSLGGAASFGGLDPDTYSFLVRIPS